MRTKRFRQHMEQEPADKFRRWQPHHLDAVVVRIIPPVEKHLVVFQGEQAGVGNGHTMRIAAQVAKHLLGSAERSLGVDHPVLAIQTVEPAAKGGRLS